MGGGSSSSSSDQTSIVETDNSNIQQNDNQVALNLEDVGDNNTIALTDQGAIASAFEFGSDALDNAFDFGAQTIETSQDFGQNVLSEASEISREAIKVAGNAQTNAFAKIKDIAASFTNNTDANTKTILLGLGGAVVVIGLVMFFNRK